MPVNPVDGLRVPEGVVNQRQLAVIEAFVQSRRVFDELPRMSLSSVSVYRYARTYWAGARLMTLEIETNSSSQ